MVSFCPQLLWYFNMLLLFKFIICCFKYIYSMEMTFHFERLVMGAFRILAFSAVKNSNILLLFTFLICCFKYAYSMEMTFHYERLGMGAFRIYVASSTGRNSILFHIEILKSYLTSNNAWIYINEPPLGWYTSKSFQPDVPNNF